MEGYVYVLVNSSLQNLVKIGFTTKSPKDRANELSGTGVPSRFVVAYSIYVTDCAAVEAQVHNLFANQRHNADREFFEIDATTAIDGLIKIGEAWKTEPSQANGKQIGKTSSLYLAKIANYSNVYRIGLIEEDESYLLTEQFRNDIRELYTSYDIEIILGDIKLIHSEEFDELDDDAFREMNSILDRFLKLEKSKNSHNYFSPKKYDERTLNFRVFDEYTTYQIFERAFESVKSSAINASKKIAEAKAELLEIERNKKIQNLRSKGI